MEMEIENPKIEIKKIEEEKIEIPSKAEERAKEVVDEVAEKMEEKEKLSREELEKRIIDLKAKQETLIDEKDLLKEQFEIQSRVREQVLRSATYNLVLNSKLELSQEDKDEIKAFLRKEIKTSRFLKKKEFDFPERWEDYIKNSEIANAQISKNLREKNKALININEKLKDLESKITEPAEKLD